MKATKIGEPKVIISNPESIHNYFAWPTVTKLKNGKLKNKKALYPIFGKALFLCHNRNHHCCYKYHPSTYFSHY